MVWAAVAAATASVPVVRMSNGLNWAPDGTATGDHKFVTLYPAVQDGVNGLWCSDCACGVNNVCIQGTAGVDGAFAFRQNGAWNCLCQGPGGPGCFQCSDLSDCNICPLVAACMAPCVPLAAECTASADCCEGFCLGGTCQVPTCLPNGEPCVNNADCCSNSCVDGICAATTTTVTTTSTSTSTTSTTLPCVTLGGDCTTTSECCEGFCSGGVCTTAGGGAGATSQCITIDPALPDTTDFEMWIANAATTLIDATCYCVGTCSVGSATVTFTDRAGNQIDMDGAVVGQPSMECQFGSTADSAWHLFLASDPDRILGSGEGLDVSLAGVSVDRVIVCVRYSQ